MLFLLQNCHEVTEELIVVIIHLLLDLNDWGFTIELFHESKMQIIVQEAIYH